MSGRGYLLNSRNRSFYRHCDSSEALYQLPRTVAKTSGHIVRQMRCAHCGRTSASCPLFPSDCPDDCPAGNSPCRLMGVAQMAVETPQLEQRVCRCRMFAILRCRMFAIRRGPATPVPLPRRTGWPPSYSHRERRDGGGHCVPKDSIRPGRHWNCGIRNQQKKNCSRTRLGPTNSAPIPNSSIRAIPGIRGGARPDSRRFRTAIRSRFRRREARDRSPRPERPRQRMDYRTEHTWSEDRQAEFRWRSDPLAFPC